MWEYTDKVREHFLNPRNVGTIENADGIGEVGSLACGDALKLFITVDETEHIVDAKFQTFGCASAIASSSALTEMVIGKTVAEAREITNEDIADFLGGLPKEKMHCSVMGRDALEKAIQNLRGETAPPVDGEVVCHCFGVTDNEIKRAVTENHLKTIEDVTDYVKAGGACGNCHEQIQAIIDTALGIQTPKKKKKVAALTNLQKIKMVEEAFESEIKPALAKDGGDIQLVDVDGDRIFVKLRGACASCTRSDFTLKHYVESKLRELVADDLMVEEV